MEELWRGGYRLWSDATAEAEVRFVGARRPEGAGDSPRTAGRAHAARPRILAAIAAAGEAVPPCVGLRQVHSARVVAVPAAEGRAMRGPAGQAPAALDPAAPAALDACLIGEGDALVTGQAGLALSVITADCVPVLLAGDGAAAAVHAGWRGIEAGVVPAAVGMLSERLAADPGRLTAWIGPAIGPCCYEVGDEVADRVAAAVPGDSAAVRVEGRGDKPHLDLVAAVAAQLTAAGLGAPRILRVCTRCNGDLLHSYRREGKGAGRNLAYVWLR